jgi:hypothetical protein
MGPLAVFAVGSVGALSDPFDADDVLVVPTTFDGSQPAIDMTASNSPQKHRLIDLIPESSSIQQEIAMFIRDI